MVEYRLPLICLLLYVATPTGNPTESIKEEDYRLPRYIIPDTYFISLRLSAYLPQRLKYRASVQIMFYTARDIHKGETISVNIKKLFIRKAEIATVWDTPLNATFESNHELERLTFHLHESLKGGVMYKINTNYSAKINKDNYGLHFIRFVYKEQYTWAIATRLAPVYARTVFPCLDEPNFRAHFKINVTHPAGYRVLSNSDYIITPARNGWVRTRFTETPSLPPHLIALVILPKHEKNVYTHQYIQHRFYLTEFKYFSSSVLLEAFSVLRQITDVFLPSGGLVKVTHVSIPGFSEEVVSTWGLIIYRSSSVYVNESDASAAYNQRVASILTYAAVYMFFGTIRVCDWWNNAWVTEGVSRFFQYYTLSEMRFTEQWEIMNQFLIEQQEPMLRGEGLQGIASLSPPKKDVLRPIQIIDVFTSARTYRKGASLVRTLLYILGKRRFLKGIKRYMSKNYIEHYHNVSPADLWNAWIPSNINHALPEGKALTDVMMAWVTGPGCPIVHIQLQSNEQLKVKANRYLQKSTKCSMGRCDARWFIPTTYTTYWNPNFKNTIPYQEDWINGDSVIVLNVRLHVDYWIVVNLQSVACMRVMYGFVEWYFLHQVLKTKHRDIHVLNRAQLLNERFSLMLSGHISTRRFLYLTMYLVNETEYYPWYSALHNFDYIIPRIDFDSQNIKLLYEFLKQLIEKVYKNVKANWNSTHHIDILKRNLIMEWACRIDYGDCVSDAKMQFNRFITEGVRVNPNDRSYVYCTGIKYSGNIRWHTLRRFINTSTEPSHTDSIIEALGCSTSEKILDGYMVMGLDIHTNTPSHYNEKIFLTVISHSPLGFQLGLQYMMEFPDTLALYYTTQELIRMVAELADRVRDEIQAQQFNNLLDRYITYIPVQSAREAAERCKRNMDWDKTSRNRFLAQLPLTIAKLRGGGNSSTKFPIWFFVIIKYLLYLIVF